MIRRKILILALMIVMIFTICGCSNAEDNQNATSDTQTQTEKTEIKFKEITDGQLEYNIPKQWKNVAKEEESFIGTVTSYDADNNCIVSVQCVTWEQIKNSTFGEFYTDVQQFMEGEISSIKYSEDVADISEEKINIAGTQGEVLEYKYEPSNSEEIATVQRDIFFNDGDVFYHININNMTEENEELFNFMIDSVKLN